MKLSNTKILVISGIVLTLILVSQSAAAKAEVNLINPDSFTDIKQPSKNSKKSTIFVKNEFQKLFERVSTSYMNKEETLKIEVIDVDLPGRVEYMIGQYNESHRVLKQGDRFRIKFKFQIMDKNGEIISQGDESLSGFFKEKS